jgi:YVTN family beta-propeller protein
MIVILAIALSLLFNLPVDSWHWSDAFTGGEHPQDSGSPEGPARTVFQGPQILSEAPEDLGGSLNATVALGQLPQSPTYDPANGNLFVANYDSNNLSVINGSSNQVSATIDVMAEPLAATYDSMNHDIYVSDYGANNVTVISGGNNSILTNIPVGIGPEAPTYDPANGDLYVADNGENNITIINGTTNTVLGNLTVGNSPLSITYADGNGNLYVDSPASENISVVDGATNLGIGSISTGSFSDPYPPAYDSANGNLYVPDPEESGLEVLSTNSSALIGEILLGGMPAENSPAQTPPLYDNADGDIYVALEGTDDLTMISGTTDTIVQNITVANQPSTPVIDPDNGYLYVATDINSTANGTVSVVSGASLSIVENVGVGADPFLGTFDPSNGEIYFSNSGSNDLSVIGNFSPPTYAVTFEESGLGFGTNWSIDLDGSWNTSSTSTVGFMEPIGNYTYSVLAVEGYLAAYSSGSVQISGTSPPPIAIVFNPLYTVTFSETGLPQGSLWSVTLNGTLNESHLSTVSFDEQGGNYRFSVTGVTNYTDLPSTGDVTVDGQAVWENITFTHVPPGKYPVTFTENGLPSGMRWFLTLNGSEMTSTATAITYYEPNGSYAFAAAPVETYIPKPNSGNLTVHAGPANESINFASPTFPTFGVSFVETGLPPSTTWSVKLNGTSKISNGSSISFSEPNGTYPLLVQSYDPSWAANYTPSVTVSGGPQNLSIDFFGFTYPVEIHEIGVPTGRTWSAKLGLLTQSSTNATIPFNEGNGTYDLLTSVQGSASYSKSFKIVGPPSRITVEFYEVNFTEEDLPSGTTWAVTLNGVAQESNVTGLQFFLANETYSLSVRSELGFAVQSLPPTLTVSGLPLNYTLDFVPQTQAQGFVGLPATWFLLLAAGALAVTGLLVVLLLRRTGQSGEVEEPGQIWPFPGNAPSSGMDAADSGPLVSKAIETGSPPPDYYEGLVVQPPLLTSRSDDPVGGAATPTSYPLQLSSIGQPTDSVVALEVSLTTIRVKTLPVKSASEPIEAEFTRIEPKDSTERKVAVTDQDAERLVASLILRPRSLDALKQGSHLPDEALLALIEGMVHAGLVLEGKQAATGQALYALAPLGFRIAQRALPAASAEPTGPLPAETVPISLSQRVVLHLYGLGSLREDEVAPSGFTQAGMASVFHRPPGTFAKVLQRLEEASVLSHDTRHVQGQKRRLKVYRLTARGEGLAKELRRQGLRWPPP